MKVYLQKNSIKTYITEIFLKFLLLIIIIFFLLLLLIIKKKLRKNMENNYYILITSDKQSTYKLYNILNKLIDQINKYMFDNKDVNIKIFVCNDNIDKHMKKQLLLKETNY